MIWSVITPGEAAREGHDHGDEQAAHREQPQLRELLGKHGLAPVDQQRSGDRADDGVRPPTAQKITISIDGTMPTKDGDMKPTCSVNIAPPIAAIAAARQKTKIL